MRFRSILSFFQTLHFEISNFSISETYDQFETEAEMDGGIAAEATVMKLELSDSNEEDERPRGSAQNNSVSHQRIEVSQMATIQATIRNGQATIRNGQATIRNGQATTQRAFTMGSTTITQRKRTSNVVNEMVVKSTGTDHQANCFKCRICAFVAINLVKLNQHMRIHNGDKPYDCDQCDAQFYRNESLKKHKRLHTKRSNKSKTIKKPKHCEFCEKDFQMHGNLKRHLHKYHQ